MSALPVYSSHHCHSTLSHADHLHIRSTHCAVSPSLPYQDILSSPQVWVFFFSSPQSPSLGVDFFHLSPSGRGVFGCWLNWFLVIRRIEGGGGEISRICRTITLPLEDVGDTSPGTYTCGVHASGRTDWRVFTDFMAEELLSNFLGKNCFLWFYTAGYVCRWDSIVHSSHQHNYSKCHLKSYSALFNCHHSPVLGVLAALFLCFFLNFSDLRLFFEVYPSFFITLCWNIWTKWVFA